MNKNSVGASAYTLVGWTRNAQILLTRNPHYWRPLAPFERVVIRHMSDSATQLLAVKRGDIGKRPARIHRIVFRYQIIGIVAGIIGEHILSFPDLGRSPETLRNHTPRIGAQPGIATSDQQLRHQ